MRKALSAPFYFQAGQRAVLLLHGFTGSSADVRMLGRFLEKHGYTSHAPHYKGHGVPPEELIISNPEEWWHDAVAGYHFLKDQGYEEIAVIGLSLGGVFSLKIGLNLPVKGIVTMCAPMTMRTTDVMFAGVLDYAKQYKIQQRLNEQEIEKLFISMANLHMDYHTACTRGHETQYGVITKQLKMKIQQLLRVHMEETAAVLFSAMLVEAYEDFQKNRHVSAEVYYKQVQPILWNGLTYFTK